MEALVEQLDQLFEHKFPGPTHPISPILPNSARVGGFVVWDDFEGMSQHERQRKIWTALRENVAPEDIRRITAILTLTPLEEQAILENE